MEQFNETKKKILDASLELFSRNGFNATSVRQIAREVGVRESAIYNHFKGKDDIIQTLIYVYGIGKTKSCIEKLKNDNRLISDPYIFLKEVATNEILKLICNDESNKFKKIMIMEMFCVENARHIIERDIFGQARTLLKEIFEFMIEKKLIKWYNPLLLANEFLAPFGLISLEYLITCSAELDMEYLKKQIEGHIDFFWGTVKNDE